VRSDGRRFVTLRWKRMRTTWFAGCAAEGRTKGVAMVEGCRVGPSFAEGVFEVTDRWASNLQLHVVPRRIRAVAGVQRYRLGIARVSLVVMAAMAQINTADEDNWTEFVAHA